MYAEFATDAKVQMMSEADQRRFVMLLCLRCNGDVTLHDEEVAFQLRISNDDWLQTKSRLMAKNLIDNNNSPTAWDKRQYTSDSSAERVAKHRANKKQQVTTIYNKEKAHVTKCNVTVTPPDTDTDTDTDTENYEREEIAVLTESKNDVVQNHAFSQTENFNPANLPTTNRTQQAEPPTAIVSMEARSLTAKLHKDTAKRIAGFTPDVTRWADETAIAKLLKAGATQADIETVWAFATTKPFWAGKIATPKDLTHNWVKLSQEAKATTARQTPAQAQASKNGYPVLDREGWTAQPGEGWYTPSGTREGWHDGVFYENDCEMLGVAA
jgi:hypothetical protein